MSSDASTPTDTPPDADRRETVDVPARFAEEIAARQRLHERCPVDVFVAGVNPRYSWPNRLVSAREANRPALRRSCDTLIVDSVMQDDYFPVPDILDAADEIDADYVVMKDYPSAPDATLDAYDRFMSFYVDHPTTAEVVPVLSPGRIRQQWRTYAVGGPDHPMYGIGGLCGETPERQVRALRTAREVAGDDVRLHAFGVGTSAEAIHALRESAAEGRPLVDSLDISTPENAVANNKIPGKRWQQRRVPLPGGVDSTTVRAGFAEAVARMLAYELTPDCEESLFSGTGVRTL